MALVAVWLTALVPTVSRSLVAFAPSPAHEAMGMPMAGHHHAMGHMPARHDAHGAPGCDDACGYCTLFTQLPAMAGSFFVGHALPPSNHAPVVAPTFRAEPPARLTHAPARGPPFAFV
ncbi:DUF2946 domain-containing protein [Luteibacter sp.]|jgi:hypothetical protein|uniref:DUF2946 domain-containing protein n=1 Tax=Luteibacter sp. TaxID=1886636 RepID=UPI002F3F44F3